VLGKITASGKYNLSLSAASDGSQVPDLICAQDCDATSADADCLAYRTGRFNDNALTLGAAHTVASITEGLRAKGIHLVHGSPRNRGLTRRTLTHGSLQHRVPDGRRRGPQAPAALLPRPLLPRVETFGTEAVDFDVIDRKRRIAPARLAARHRPR
jgi:hypothetical protein